MVPTPTPAAFLLMALVLTVAPAPLLGGEPDAATQLEDLPGGTRESVTQLLAKTLHDYGENAVVIETQLLLNVLRNGSQLAAGVRVEGVDDYAGQRYLRFHLETGLVFDDSTRSTDARVHMLWLTLMEPMLASVGVPDIPAAGIAVEMESSHRPYANGRELRATIDDTGVSEEITFYVLTAVLTALAQSELTVRDLFARCRITIDGSERTVRAPPDDASRLAGPP